MQNKNNYLVDKDWYKAYVEQLDLNKMRFDVQKVEVPVTSIIRKIYSKETDTLLCEAIYYDESENNKFYIYADPNKDESQPPQAKTRVTLETPEQVQLFINMYNKLIKGEKL